VNVLTAVFASSTNSTSTISDVEPGLLGFLVVAALGLALVFLLRSMNKQFRKLGPKPEEDEAEGASVAGASAAAGQRPLRGLAAHRAAMAAAEATANAESDAKRDLPGHCLTGPLAPAAAPATPTRRGALPRAAPTSPGR
jgi:hypothetical protein